MGFNLRGLLMLAWIIGITLCVAFIIYRSKNKKSFSLAAVFSAAIAAVPAVLFTMF